MRIPKSLGAEFWHERDWLERLPALAGECAELWGLELEEPVDTPHSLVVPAGEVVLKVNAPSHFEADHEAEALARWAGNGAVRVLARDDSRRAYVCERCRPGLRLEDTGADGRAIVSRLLPRLSLEPEERHPFRRLADEAERWAAVVPERYETGGRPFERELLDYALDVFRSTDRGAVHLVNQDLHGGNILSATREPWLVIDPKPLLGERELDGVGLLRNAVFRRESIAGWLDALEELGLDRERLRGWGVAHALAWGWDTRIGWSKTSIAAAQGIARAS